ncbi:hypothetical protein ACJU26_03240 [Acidithiobacillus sp. M4-SHS-6]|uniref:hypothetical protein n=1 Tax=Acidithiobacillus sp. M4-SHS-6 TaxID=3383024 RepID=UPI0039BE8E91
MFPSSMRSSILCHIKNAIFPVMFGIAMINACAASADDFDPKIKPQYWKNIIPLFNGRKAG